MPPAEAPYSAPGGALLDPNAASAPRTNGWLLWLIAAGALVAGILIGFVSGYNAGRGSAVSLLPAAVTDLAPPSQPAPAAEAPAQTFTEDAVDEPVRIDPEPIINPPDPREDVEPAPAMAPPPVRRAQPEPPRAPPVERTAPIERAASGPGSLQVLSRPAGAQVVLDGRVVGRTPLVMGEVGPGSHDVRLELEGFRGWRTSVQVAPGERTRVAASLEQ